MSFSTKLKKNHSYHTKVYILVIVLYSTKYRDKIQPSHSIAPSNKYIYILLKYALKREISICKLLIIIQKI